jgi:predicted branched-subunit amino acid permease
MDGYERNRERSAGHAHYLGGAVVLWAVWLVAIGVGATLGAQLPTVLRLELVIPLYLVGEVVGRHGEPTARPAVGLAAAVAVAAFAAPMHLGILLAIVSGLFAALTIKGRSR